MFILGLISLIQIAFLPGYILSSFFPSESILRKGINSFALSLLANYFIIVTLVLFGAYTQVSMWLIFSLEIILATIIYRKKSKTIDNTQRSSFWKWIQAKPCIERYTWEFWITTSIILSAICVYLGKQALAGTIFDGWDPVFSWNRWAVEWSNGIFPTGTYHYPQLLPTNFSISYAMQGTDKIDFFAHALMFFFPLIQFAAFFNLGIQKKSLYFFSGLFFCALFNLINNLHYFGMGLADIPVATFCFLSITCLFYAQDELHRKQNLLLGALYTVAACLTKQMGFLFLIMYPLLAYALIENSKINNSKHIKYLCSLLLFSLALVLPWYIYKQLQITNGNDHSEIGYLLTTIHENRNIWERLDFALSNLFRKPTLQRIFNLTPNASLALFWSLLLSATFIFLLSFKDKHLRWVGLLVSLPAFFIWALIYNYDSRNLAAALPVMALNMGYGILGIPAILDSILDGFVIVTKKTYSLIGKTYSVIFSGIILTPLIIYINHTWDKEKMIASHDLQILGLGNPKVNARLYEYHKKTGIQGGILTHYPHLIVLPDFKDLYRGCNMANLNEFKEVSKNYTDITYLLVPPWPLPGKGLHGEVPKLISNKDVTLIFEEDGFYFLKQNRLLNLD